MALVQQGTVKFREAPVDRCIRSRSRSPHMSLCYRSSSPLSMCGLQEEEDPHTTLVSATLQQRAAAVLTQPLVHYQQSVSSSVVNICNTFLLLAASSLLLSFFLPLHLKHQQSPPTFSQPRSLHTVVPSSDSQQLTDSLTL